MDKENKNYNPEDSLFTDDIVKALLIIVGFFGIFVLAFNIFGSDKAPETEAAGTTVIAEQTVADTQIPTVPSTVASTAAPTAAPETTTAAAAENTTAAPAVSEESTTAAASSGQMSTAEIIRIFNESANKVKTDAVKVVKNFEHRTHNEEKLILPSALEGMLGTMMESAFADDTEPIEYPTKEEIIAAYPVPGESWSSQLTEAEVAEATCTDNGTEYEIMIKLHPTKNPEPGVGIAKAFDCITASELSSAPDFVENISTEYYDCVVKCKIDKATGRTVWSNYSSPVVMFASVNMGFTKLDAQVGLTFEKDYTITY